MSDSTTPVTAAVPPPGFEINLVNPPYVGYQLVAVACAFAALSTLVVGLRLFTRNFLVKTMGWDDMWVTIAWASSLGTSTRYQEANDHPVLQCCLLYF